MEQTKSPSRKKILGFKPNPLDPSPVDTPCLDFDPRRPDFLAIARHCPLRIMPGLNIGRKWPAKIAKPDLVIAAHQSTASIETEVVHTVSIRNIGQATAVIGGPSEPDSRVVLQFYVSMNPLLDGEYNRDYAAAGGWSVQEQRIEPGEEIELQLEAGPGVPPRPNFNYMEYNYVIAQLTAPPTADQNTENNLSIVPLLVG